MKNTLRILSAAIALLTLCLCFAACGGKDSDSALTFQNSAGVAIPVGAAADPIIETLGTGVTAPLESASCGGIEGKDYVYTYRGFRVSTTPAKDGQIICKVELTDDSVKTPEGLYIGMSRADAEEAMKSKKSESTGGNLVYGSENTKLQVIIRDDSVAGIVYVAK